MIQTIFIRNLALIEEARITFEEGLQVLTGETGAGKSIVVDAVTLILGGRADKDMIRTGTDKAVVEAVFDAPDHPKLQELLQKQEIESDGRTVPVTREISAGGRNICRVCGVIVPLSVLKEIVSCLLDLHGQNEYQYMADPSMHLTFLDQIGQEEHRELTERVKENYEAFISNHRAYAKLVREKDLRAKRSGDIRKELEILRKANFKPDEEARLQTEKDRLSNSEKNAEALRRACLLINETDAGESALGKIQAAVSPVREIAEKNPGAYSELYERLQNACYELEEISYELSKALDEAESDPERLEKVKRRLELIRRLENKYGSDLTAVINAREGLEREFVTLTEAEEKMELMAAEHKTLLQKYRQSAKELTESRKQLAAKLEEMMKAELNELGMPGIQFQVFFQPPADNRPQMPTENGDDRIEFLISPNPGEPLKPLAKIASGGELSRLMLAFKNLEAGFSGVHSMVFDEIDTGISGRMAQIVAEKMISISRRRQVICVSHLPQIAAAADDQYLVQKQSADDRTRTTVVKLDKEGRIHEVARMISGAEGVTQETSEYARSLLEAAERLKK